MLLFLSLFIYFHLFFISLFFFSEYFFSDKYNSIRDTKGKCRTDRTGYTRAAIATWEGMEGADRVSGYVYFYFLSFLPSSFVFIIIFLL